MTHNALSQLSKLFVIIKKNINIRLTIICAAAASVGLSMAFISIAKFLLLLCGLAVLLQTLRREPISIPQALQAKATPIAIVVVLTAFTAGLIWTVAPVDQAFGSLAKYGKLLIIVFIMCLIRSKREALLAVTWFAGSQLLLVLGSLALFMGVSVPWSTSKMAMTEYAVFSTYLDQGIMSAVFALLCWHLRSLVPGKYGPSFAIAASVLSLSSVLFVLSGRSGHLVAIGVLSLAIMWELPKRFRGWVVILPFIIAAVLFATSEKVRDRLTMVNIEVQSYSKTTQNETSSGIRLMLWRYALIMIEQHPAKGLGTGSWTTEFNRLQHADNPSAEDINPLGNPHQEYLLWGSQLGFGGILLLLGLMLSILKDSMKMEVIHKRALQTCLAGLAIACLVNSSIYDALIGDFFCITLGLLLALGANYKDDKSSVQKPKTMPA
jgi:O-antigen ligase